MDILEAGDSDSGPGWHVLITGAGSVWECGVNGYELTLFDNHSLPTFCFRSFEMLGLLIIGPKSFEKGLTFVGLDPALCHNGWL